MLRMIQSGAVVGVLGALLLLVAPAHVHATCTTSSSYSNDSGSYTESYTGTCNSSGTVTTSAAVVKAATQATVGLIAGRVSSFTRSAGGVPTGPQQTADFAYEAGRKGKAAGNGAPKAGVWVNFNWSGIKQSTEGVNFEGDLYSGIAGIDYQVSDKVLLGIAATFEGVKTDNTFQAGDSSSFAYGFAPYAAYLIDDTFSVNAMGGFAIVDGDTSRRVNAVETGDLVTGDFDASRYYFSVNGNGNFWFSDNVSLGTGVGVVWAEQMQDAYTETNQNTGATTDVEGFDTILGQFQANLEPRYLAKVAREAYLEPYAALRYEYDFTRTKISTDAGSDTHPNDRSGLHIGAGLSAYIGAAISANIEATHELIRENQGNTSVTGTLRYQF